MLKGDWSHMPTMRRLLFIFAVLGFLQIGISAGKADTVLTNPTELQFSNALALGGNITFSGNTSLTLTNTYTLQKNTVIDAKNFILDLKVTKTFIIIPNNLSLTVSGLSVKNCYLELTNGGVFLNRGTFTLTNSTFTGNTFAPIGLYQPIKGGIIYNDASTLRINNCAFTANNTAQFAGTPISGGAIYNAFGNLYLTNTVFSGNAMAGLGFNASEAGADCLGAGIYSSGYCSINQSSFVDNSVNATGGARNYNNPAKSQGGAIYSSGTLVIADSTLTNNRAVLSYKSSYGGAIFSSGSLTIDHSRLSQNSAGSGGAIYNEGDCSLDRVILQENSSNEGGAIGSIGVVKVNSSTLVNNSANGGSEYIQYVTPTQAGPTVAAGNGTGGGIFNRGQMFSTNCTFFGNKARGGSGNSQAPGSGLGGAVYTMNSGPAVIFAHVTFQSNSVSLGSASGSTLYNAGTAPILANSILSGGNTSAVWGPVTDYGNNICFDSSANLTAAGSYNSQDANLGRFGTYGGFTPTVLLLPGSVAIDHAYPPFVPATDQRGVVRNRSTADIGSFEYVPVPATTPSFVVTNFPALFPGMVLHIFGANFLYTTNLNISGISVDFDIISDTEITLTVPSALPSGNLEARTLTGISSSGPAVRSWLEILDVRMTNRILIVRFIAATNGVNVKLGYGSSSTNEFSQTQTTLNAGTNTVQFSITNIVTSTFVAGIQFVKDSYVNNSLTYSFSIPPPRVVFSGWNVTFPSPTTASVEVTLESEVSGFVNFRYGRAGNATGYLPPVDRSVGTGTQSLSVTITGVVPGTTNIVVGEFRYLHDGFMVTSPPQTFVVPTPFRDQNLTFNAYGQYVAVAHKTSLNAFPLTISAWFKTTQTIGYVGLVSKFEPGETTGYQVSIIDGILHAFYLKDSTSKITENPEGVSGGAVADGNWHHVDYLVSSEGSQLFVDGVLKNTALWVGTFGPTSSTSPLRFGYYYNGYEGELDEVELWNKAKTAGEVANYRVPADPADPLLLGYWKFNQGAGSTLADTSSNGNDGQINGGPSWTISGVPIIRNSNLLLAGSGGLSIAGPVGGGFILEQSSDLNNWLPVSTNQFDATGFSSLIISPAGSKKFFRVKNF